MKTLFQFQSNRKDLMFWAVVPLGLVFVGYMGSWWSHSAGWSGVIGLPVPYFLALALLTAGVMVGLRRRLPPWTYSWLAQTLYTGSPLLVTLITIIVLPSENTLNSDAQTRLSIASQGMGQLVVFLALACSLPLVKRNRVDALFLFALFLGGRTVSFPIQPADMMTLPSGVVTTGLATLALAEGFLVALVILHFLTGSPNSWKPFQWLLGLILLDPVLKLWPVMLQGGQVLNNLRSYGTALGVSSFFTVSSLVAVFISVRLYEWLRARDISSEG